jgi:hypothetical protein
LRTIEDADDHMDALLRPYDRFDELNVRTANSLANARGNAAVAASVTAVSAPTTVATTKLLKHVDVAATELQKFAPRGSTIPASSALAQARAAGEQAQATARTEPTPKGFALKVAATYAGIGGLGVGGFLGVRQLVRNSRD